MDKIVASDLRNLYLPPNHSHKGQNGKLTIIGGSHLFHGASLWALKVASRIVDMVFYSSIPENNEIAQKLKSEAFDFICVQRENLEEYIEESDCILIGPGMVRENIKTLKQKNIKTKIKKLEDLRKIKNEGEQTYWLTKYLFERFPEKRWVVDAGSLQMMEKGWLNKNCLITPHKREFERLFSVSTASGEQFRNDRSPIPPIPESPFAPSHHPRSQSPPRRRDFALATSEVFPWLALVKKQAEKYNCTILLKGSVDIVCSPKECRIVEGGNAGMTKGGTGDVLAGLVAALYCKNDAFLAATAASLINKKAGEELFKKVGYFFNASDLADQIPRTMKKLLL